MIHLSLTACSFHLKKANSKKNSCVFCLNQPLSIKDKGGNDLQFSSCLDLFFRFFDFYKKTVSYDYNQQSFMCDFDETNYVETKDFIMYYAKIHSGYYGSSSDIIDGDTKDIKYQKQASDIDVRPFYFMVVFPKDNEKVTVQKGMFIFQNVGQYGVKTITTELMSSFFSDCYKITLQCNTIAPSLFIKKVLKQKNITKISMIKNMKSSDVADNQALGYGKEVREISDLNFSTSVWQTIMEKIEYVAGGKYRLFEFGKVQYDHLKVTVKLGDRYRVINIHNLDNLSIIESIPNTIKMENGHPDKDKLLDYLTKVVSEYLEEMVLTVDN